MGWGQERTINYREYIGELVGIDIYFSFSDMVLLSVRMRLLCTLSSLLHLYFDSLNVANFFIETALFREVAPNDSRFSRAYVESRITDMDSNDDGVIDAQELLILTKRILTQFNGQDMVSTN